MGVSAAAGLLIARAAAVIAAFLALQAVYVAYFGPWDIAFGRNAALGAAVIIALATKPLFGDQARAPLQLLGRAVDLALMAVVIAACIRFTEVQKLTEETLYLFQAYDIWLALAACLALFEATRRLFGWPIVLIAAAMLSYCLFGQFLPGVLGHSGLSLSRVMENIWYGYQGVFGMPTGVVIRVVLIFIVFGIVLEGVGASDALIRASVSLTGGTRAGPAHSAVVASALFGAMSGSVTANVVGSGTFTIPMIKRRGFSPATAGGVEAAASTGGQIVPPVLGAAAFLMADLTGEPYGVIAIAALIPALFYYASLFAAISVQAAAAGIEPLPAEQRVRLTRADLFACHQFLLPILAIVVVLLLGRSPAMAGFIATLLALSLGLLRRDVWRDPALLWRICVKAGMACASILVAVGCIGVILGALNLTGLGLSFASQIASLSEDWLLGALIVTAFACLALGMGMPTLPAYLIIVLVLGPVMTKLGVERLAAHMFVFYFGVLSAITPPVAIGAFAAAPIAGSNPMRTAFVAVRLALVGFIIPFIFVYEPALLLIGEIDPVALARVCTALVLAIWMLNTGLIGHADRRLTWFERALRLGVALGLVTQIPELQYAMIPTAIALMLIPKHVLAACAGAAGSSAQRSRE